MNQTSFPSLHPSEVAHPVWVVHIVISISVNKQFVINDLPEIACGHAL